MAKDEGSLSRRGMISAGVALAATPAFGQLQGSTQGSANSQGALQQACGDVPQVHECDSIKNHPALRLAGA